jgi:hypothetical protein
MFQNNIKSLPKLKNDDYANIFSLYTDNEGYYFYNLLQNVNIPTDLPEGYYNVYNVVYGDTWPLISYKNYNTINLWWVILGTNNIINPTTLPQPGSEIKILKNRYVSLILSEINTQI